MMMFHNVHVFQLTQHIMACYCQMTHAIAHHQTSLSLWYVHGLLHYFLTSSINLY
jgi:hypothetical protein